MNTPWRFLVLNVCIAMLTAASATAAPAGWTPLLEASELKGMLDAEPALRVLHVTGEYAAGHIPGAVNVAYSRFRGPQNNPGSLPDLAMLTALVQELGIDAATPVVVVHGGSSAADMGAAARVYWTLKSLGVKNLAVLNGGFKAWKQELLPVTTGGYQPEPSDFQPRWQQDWRVTTQEVEALVEAGDGRFLDARTPDFFQGVTASSARPGTIRGADNLSFLSWFDGGTLKPAAQLNGILASYQDAAPVTVSFCNTGHLAAINWFVLSEVGGLDNVRLYAESMREWTMADRPLINEPSRIRHYWNMTTAWFNSLRGS